MSRLKELFASLRKIRDSESVETTPHEASATEYSTACAKLLLITQCAEERDSLQQIAVECRWRMLFVESCDEAVAVLKQQPIPIVICDRDLCGQNWKEILPTIAFLPQPTCVF